MAEQVPYSLQIGRFSQRQRIGRAGVVPRVGSRCSGGELLGEQPGTAQAASTRDATLIDGERAPKSEASGKGVGKANSSGTGRLGAAVVTWSSLFIIIRL